MTAEKDNFTRISVLLTLLVVAGGFVTWLLYQTSVIYKREGHAQGAEDWIQQWMIERTARVERLESQIDGIQQEMFLMKKRVKLLEERSKNEQIRKASDR